LTRTVIACLVAVVSFSTILAAERERHARLAELAPDGDLAPDLLEPEGRSRWDLSNLRVSGTHERRHRVGDGGEIVQIDGTAERRFVDPTGGDAAERWLFPDRFGELLHPGARHVIEVEEHVGDLTRRLRLQVATVGIGWVHLPGRPYEVALQRVLVMSELPTSRGYFPETLTHRWVDPRFGVVAEVSGPASADGIERIAIDSVVVVQEVLAGADPLRVYLTETIPGPFGILTLRRERTATTVADVTANAGVTDIMSLVNQGTWDFDIASNRAGAAASQSNVVLDNFESCNVYECGYFPGMDLGRRDAAFGSTALVTSNQITEILFGDTANPSTDPTVQYFRAGAQKEGVDGAFGSGESRLCYTDKQTCAGDSSIFCRDAQDCIDAGTTGPCNFDEDLTEVPLWVFPHWDAIATDWYMQDGDPGWSSGVFNCEQNMFNQICGEPGVFDQLWSKDCTGHTGTQSGEILTEGVITLPSGHTMNAMVARTVADFCVYLSSGCLGIFQVDEVRTAVYLWQVPHLNTVALLQSEQNAPDVETFTTLDEASFAVGLMPPVTISAGGETETTVDVSWDPGKDPLGIDEYVVYWDTESGSVNDYDNSVVVPSSQTTTTIGGLAAATPYFITVTSVSHFNPFPPAPFCRRDYATSCTSDVDCGDFGPCVLTDPPTTRYESIRFPTQISGDPDNVYPVEVQITTAGDCIPTLAVENLVVGKDGANQQFCWDASADICTIGYDLLYSATADGNFTVTAQTGLETCWTGNPPFGYFRVVARGTGGSGP
jgi:hypothetical protein